MASLLEKLRSLRVAHLPPLDTEIVCFDLETSSLAPTADVLSIGAVPVNGRRILLSQAFQVTLQTRARTDPEAIKYHRLRPADLAAGQAPTEALADFREWLASRPLLAYFVEFDFAVLNRALRRSGVPALTVPAYDLRDLYRHRRRLPRGTSPDFDGIIAALDIPMAARHTALGDAVGVAYAYTILAFGTEHLDL